MADARGAELVLRPAVSADADVLGPLEAAADEPFRDAGMAQITEHAPPPAASFARWIAAGEIVVAADHRAVVGFARVVEADGIGHLAQISVVPTSAGQGVGSRLLVCAQERARSRGWSRLSLTTFRDVPWNRPWYARRGWVVVEAATLGPRHAQRWADEVDDGLHAWPRVAMVKEL